MGFKELVNDFILFFDNAKKRNLDLLKHVTRPSTRLQLEKEIDTFTRLNGFWAQENKRIEMVKSYSKNLENPS